MVTKVSDAMVNIGTRTLEAKLADIINAADYGATVAGSASANTTAINNAITAAATSGGNGFVLVSPGVSYTEASLVIPDGVVLLVFSTSGILTVLTKHQGTTLPVTKGGIAIKGQGNTGVLLRSLDYGVTAEPIMQILDLTNGDLAGLEFKFAELTEISDPTAPSANKGRLYVRDNGSGKSQLVVRFPTGAVQVIATEP